MLSVSLSAIDPSLGLKPDLREGVDYRMTSQGVAIAMTASVLEMFRQMQIAVNKAANLFGMPGAITIDGKIGSVTGNAIKFTVGKFTDDLRGNLSPGARDGITSAVAKDARNVLGTLLEAIERKSSAPIVATPLAPTIAPKQPFVLPTVIVKADPLPAPQPVLQPAPATARPKLSALAWAGIGGGILLVGVGAVLIARR
jgi:hypothetical protein